MVILVSRRWGEGQTLLYLWSQTIKQLNPGRSWEWKTMHRRIKIAEVFHFIWTRQNLYMRVLKLVFKHLRCLYACWNEAVPVLCNSYLYMKIIDTKLSWNLCVAWRFRFCFCSKVNHITGVTQQINVKTRISWLERSTTSVWSGVFFLGMRGGGQPIAVSYISNYICLIDIRIQIQKQIQRTTEWEASRLVYVKVV